MRPDLPEREKFDWPLLNWIWNWHRIDRPRAFARIAQLPTGTPVHHLRSPREVRAFLRQQL